MADCKAILNREFTDLPDSVRNELIRDMEMAAKLPDFDARVAEVKNNFLMEQRVKALKSMQETIARAEFREFALRDDFQNPHEAFLAKATGLGRTGKKYNLSYEGIKNSSVAMFTGSFERKMGGNFKAFASGDIALDRKIARAYHKLITGQDLSEFDAPIRDMARAFQEHNKFILSEMQNAGIVVRERQDHLANQSHDISAISSVTPREWADEILPKLNKKATFGTMVTDAAEQRRILESIHADMISSGSVNSGGAGTGKRVLHFASGEDWVDYNHKFGHGSLYRSIQQMNETTSRAIGQQQAFGSTNGKRVWEDMEAQIERDLNKRRDPGAKAAKEEWKSKAASRNALKSTMFGSDVPGKEIIGHTVSNIRMVNDMVLLGQAVLTTMTDFAYAPFMLRSGFGSRGFVEWNTLKDNLAVMRTKDFKKHAEILNMEFSDMAAENFSRFGQGTGVTGQRGNTTIRNMHNKFMQVSGIRPQTNRAKVANARRVAIIMSDNSNKRFGELNDRTRGTLDRYGIDADDWDIIRRAQQEVNGVKMITPERIMEMTDISSVRASELNRKYSVMLMDMAKVGSPESSFREQAFWSQGLGQDTAWGGAARLISQYSTFASTLPRIYRRIAMSNPNADNSSFRSAIMNTGNLAMTSAMMVEATVIAGAMLALRNAINGQETEFNAQFVQDAIGRGALPLVYNHSWDILRGEYESFGRSAMIGMMGPTASVVDPVLRLVPKAVGDMEKVFKGELDGNSRAAQDAWKIIMQRYPGQNLHIWRAITASEFHKDLADYLNPGYNDRIKRDPGGRQTEGNPFSAIWSDEE